MSYAQLAKLIKRVPTEKETDKIIADLQAIDAGDVSCLPWLLL